MTNNPECLDVSRHDDEDMVDYIARMCDAIFAPTTEERMKMAKRKRSHEQWVRYQARLRQSRKRRSKVAV